MSHGLQPERTDLAWHRTALAAGFSALLLLRRAATAHWGVLVVPAVLAATLAITLAVSGELRKRRLQGRQEPVSPVLLGGIAILTAITTVAALFGLL